MTQTLSITQARAQLPEMVNSAKKKLNEYVITVNGSPAAVIISAAEYDSWKETLDVLSNPSLLKAIRKGEEEFERGDFVTFDQLKEELNLHV